MYAQLALGGSRVTPGASRAIAMAVGPSQA
jgi:hypothetical protein